MNYYNEWEPKKAAWLRELISQGHIPKGEVDERSIADVPAADLRGFSQCHFFAGIGVWSYALRLAGWPEDRQVWTGSCPCPSFSAAGKGSGFADPRHIWPHWARIIRESKPDVIFGEQSADAIGHGWLDLVSVDMEREDYAVGSVVFPACSVGAPHRRQRLYWVADAECSGYERGVQRGEASGTDGTASREAQQRERSGADSGICGSVNGLADNCGEGLPERERDEGVHCGENGTPSRQGTQCDRDTFGMGHAELQPGRSKHEPESRRRITPEIDASSSGPAGPVNGFWRSTDWVLTRPQRVGDRPGLRPVEPGTFPLAHGATQRVGRLRGYGDAIVAQQAKAFIRAYLNCRP